MTFNHLTNEDIINHVVNTADERTELEIALAERLARLVDELEDADGNDTRG